MTASFKTSQTCGASLDVSSLLPGHAHLDQPVDLSIGGADQLGPVDRPGVVLGLQDAGHELGVIAEDRGRFGLQADVDLEPVGHGLAVLLPPAALP